MTNKEAKEKLYMEWQKFLEDNIDYAGVSEAYKMAFKALEQEPILDKIREQIKSNLRGVEITLEVLVENDPLRSKMEGAKDTLEECLNLIDKAEKEVDNG